MYRKPDAFANLLLSLRMIADWLLAAPAPCPRGLPLDGASATLTDITECGRGARVSGATDRRDGGTAQDGMMPRRRAEQGAELEAMATGGSELNPS